MLIVLIGCGNEPPGSLPGSSAAGKPPNLILISLDTLRADRLGCYGYDLPTSPFLDRISRHSVLLTDVLAQNPATVLSHRAIFTGLYVHRQDPGLAPAESTLAGRLARAGYETAAFTDGGLMHARFGNNPGFQLYNDDAGGAAAVFRRGLDWLNRRNATAGTPGDPKPFFLFLHTYDIHYPYTPPAPFDSMFLPGPEAPYHLGSDHGHGYWNRLSLQRDEFIWISRRYDGGIRRTDRELMNLWAELSDRNILQNTVVIVVSDHGESLGERRYVGHHELYDVQLRVPAIFQHPDWKPGILDGAFETVDFLPTALDIVSLPSDNALPGRSIAGFAGRTVHPGHLRPRLSETWARAFRMGPDWKFILRATPAEDELYRPESDPEEMRNVAAEFPEKTEEFRQKVIEFTGFTAESIRKGRKQVEMPILLMADQGKAEQGGQDELMNQLKELGYMQ